MEKLCSKKICWMHILNSIIHFRFFHLLLVSQWNAWNYLHSLEDGSLLIWKVIKMSVSWTLPSYNHLFGRENTFLQVNKSVKVRGSLELLLIIGVFAVVVSTCPGQVILSGNMSKVRIRETNSSQKLSIWSFYLVVMKHFIFSIFSTTFFELEPTWERTNVLGVYEISETGK